MAKPYWLGGELKEKKNFETRNPDGTLIPTMTNGKQIQKEAQDKFNKLQAPKAKPIIVPPKKNRPGMKTYYA